MLNKSVVILTIFMAGTFAALFFLKCNHVNQPEHDLSLVLAHDKGNMPGFQHSFSLQGEMSEAQTGIGFSPVSSPTTDLYIHQMKASLPTRSAPALFTWWSTWHVRDLVDQGLISDLTHLWDMYADDYSPEMRQTYSIGDRVYGFPYSMEYWPVWYNKPLFEKLDIREPSTWQEFTHACQRLKNASVAPILSSLQFKWYSCIWFAALVMGENPLLYEQLCNGQVNYTDSRIRKVMDIWADMIRQDWFTDPSANMFTNAGYLFNNEKFGMVLCGSWYYAMVLRQQGVDESDIGVFILPPHNPDAPKSIMMESGLVFMAKNSLHEKEAQVVARWWMSPEGSRHFAEVFQSYSANTKVGKSHLPPAKKELLSAINKQNCRILNRYWEATPTYISERAIEGFSRFILDPGQKEAVLTEIEQAAQSFWIASLPQPRQEFPLVLIGEGGEGYAVTA